MSWDDIGCLHRGQLRRPGAPGERVEHDERRGREESGEHAEGRQPGPGSTGRPDSRKYGNMGA
jgi:hypothetical protein